MHYTVPEREREREREIEREVERWRDGEMERERETQKRRQTECKIDDKSQLPTDLAVRAFEPEAQINQNGGKDSKFVL